MTLLPHWCSEVVSYIGKQWDWIYLKIILVWLQILKDIVVYLNALDVINFGLIVTISCATPKLALLQCVNLIQEEFIKNTPSIFEKLEGIGVCVFQNIRHYPFYACFDFECYFSTESLPKNGEMLSFAARHVPLSVGIASNISGYEEAVCYISDGDESDLVKKMVGYLNKLADAAFEILHRVSNRFK